MVHPDNDSLPEKFSINPLLVDNAEYRTQDGWINRFNELGTPMPSSNKIYEFLRDNPSENFPFETLSGIFGNPRIITSTRTFFDRVIHDYKSAIVSPSTIIVRIPFYDGVSLTELLNEESGVEHLRALFGTEDLPSNIISVLERLSKKSAGHIRIFTPDYSLRDHHLGSVVSFEDFNKNFYIGRRGFDNLDGQAYGMFVSSQRAPSNN